MIRTKRGAARRYNAIINQCRKDFAGGLQFGMDFPTIAAVFPCRYQELCYIKSIYEELKP